MAALANHHSSQEYRPEGYYSNVVNADGKYLGPYIPYIGKSYFETKPRLLIYAMAQNLNRAEGLVRSWLDSPDKGMLRQHRSADTTHVHVYPYDNGHLKVIAALVLNSYPDTCYKPTDNIDDLVVITNFVKFSFYREDKRGNHLDSNPPLSIYDVMWERYCKYEISVLQPNIIIGVGNDVANALERNLKTEKKLKLVMLKVPFPGKLNLNALWIPKGKHLIKTENHDPAIDTSEMKALLKGTPDKEGRVDRAIRTDWYYFREMKSCLTKKLSSLPC
ncbi:hypothetical protein ACFLUE_01200 [Chloroflexota bacterium]